MRDDRGMGKGPVNGDSTDVIRSMAEDAGDLAVQIAQAHGHADAISAELAQQRSVFDGLHTEASRMNEASAAVESATRTAKLATEAAHERLDTARAGFLRVMDQVRTLTREADGMGDSVDALAHAIEGVRRSVEDIAEVAQLTNMLALNAQVEAARAGQSGRGFMVVAEEVKAMSERTAAATSTINKTLQNLRGSADGIAKTNAALLARTLSIRDETSVFSESMDAIDSAMTEVNAQQEQIEAARRDSARAIGVVDQSIRRMDESVGTAERGIAGLRSGFGKIVETSESLTSDFAMLGVETVDTPYVRAVQNAARAVSEAFEQAVATGAVTLEDLFDTRYRPVPGSDPPQMTTRALPLTDQLLPRIQEPLLQLSPQVVFCAAVDRNGYLPTHNRKYSQRQRAGDPVWNAVHCRNRRIFGDRVGLAAGKSTRPFTLQAYRRDMGQGQFVMMKDVSAPIYVRGKHWGGLRLAYRVEEASL
ncbi:methyl-accepting chemotaxis protein [Pararhodobacter zhoushanensis]|uniref:Methyl-accepting chemotaxis protein n=1 Tax=Pararhodobacter zhoushanensis TaxID=2479545 RepID=A0ABT3GXE4_9RHOB|nr:methyl-accepting chemotaxis protein [Pararhodobacter zhoushanensis]MCW1932192.1 methyl-accepting chemotaxis protein [Pararhodobacter zhoushanensis]